MPTRRIETHNGEIVREGTLAFEFDTRPLDSLNAEPSGYEEPAPRAEERQLVRQLADGVWIIQRLGNRVMFVEMAEYVLVFETSLHGSHSQIGGDHNNQAHALRNHTTKAA